MKTRKLVNPEYVSELEHKIFKIETILDIVESWGEDLSYDIMCGLAIEDIRKVIKDGN